ncbi:hypothetical protein MOKP4_00100 [Mycobacterium avium subsp. hominissuis]|nr:hypothetical protein O981_26585 [Mycobacterium avium 10-5560]
MPTAVLAKCGRFAYFEDEPIAERIVGQCVDQALMKDGRAQYIVAQAYVDIFCHTRGVAQPHFEGHAALEYPESWFGGLQARHDPFEQDPSAEPVQTDARLSRGHEQSVFQGSSQCLRGAVGHEVSLRLSARSR